MDKMKAIFNFVTNEVRQTKYHIPRNHQTIGGMWTVDTYKRNDVTVQIMDEGYTIKLITPHIIATEFGDKLTIEKGALEDFERLNNTF